MNMFVPIHPSPESLTLSQNLFGVYLQSSWEPHCPHSLWLGEGTAITQQHTWLRIITQCNSGWGSEADCGAKSFSSSDGEEKLLFKKRFSWEGARETMLTAERDTGSHQLVLFYVMVPFLTGSAQNLFLCLTVIESFVVICNSVSFILAISIYGSILSHRCCHLLYLQLIPHVLQFPDWLLVFLQELSVFLLCNPGFAPVR